MSAVTTIQAIDAATLTYAPAVLAGIGGIEAAAAELPGTTKAGIVTNIVLAGAQAAEGVPVPSVEGIAALITLFCTILKSTGLMSAAKKNP